MKSSQTPTCILDVIRNDLQNMFISLKIMYGRQTIQPPSHANPEILEKSPEKPGD